MVLDNPKQEWNKRIGLVAKLLPKLSKIRVLAAFNSNVDHVKAIDPEAISDLVASLDEQDASFVREKSVHLEFKAAASQKEFLAALVHCFRLGKSARVVGSNQLFTWLNAFFGKPDEKLLGGQAALMISQLRELNAKSFVYLSALSADQARLIDQSILVPVVANKRLTFKKPLQSVNPHALTHSNWVFEFKKGDALTVQGEKITATRDNRFVVAHETYAKPLFSQDLEPLLPSLAKQLDLLLLSGYHSIHETYSDKTTFKQVCKHASGQAGKMKSNKKLVVHLEFVPVEHDEIEKTLLTTIGKSIDSIGLNETELVEALESLDLKKEAAAISKNESAETIYYGAVALFEKLKLKRVHVHCLGFSLVVLDKGLDPFKTRDAVLLASAATSTKSIHSKLDASLASRFSDLQISEAGFNQLGVFESTVWDALEKRKKKPISSLLRKDFMANGVFTEKNHYAVIVPAPIALSAKTTTGLGDVLSSIAIAAETAI